MKSPFAFLDPPYSAILADPPWSYTNTCEAGERGAVYKYPVMTDAEIWTLPVATLAADDCALFLWATPPRLRLAIDVIEAWGFTYKTVAFTWVKLTKTGKPYHWGMGNYTRANAEFVLLGVKGRPVRMDAGVHSVVVEPVREHSRKPDIVRERIVQLMGNVQRVELFARERTPGWDAWGNQIPTQHDGAT